MARMLPFVPMLRGGGVLPSRTMARATGVPGLAVRPPGPLRWP